MDDTNIPIIEPTIDFTKVPPIHQKRTISFINHFVVNTVSFLNKLALNCEEKLFEFENKLQRVEAAVVILESRLASVPSLEEKLPVESSSPPIHNIEDKVNDEILPPKEATTKDIDEIDNEMVDNEAKNHEELMPINKHPLYEKYFKMKNYGVPIVAVKKKMAEDGLDPDLLDNPQHQVPIVNSERPETTD